MSRRHPRRSPPVPPGHGHTSMRALWLALPSWCALWHLRLRQWWAMWSPLPLPSQSWGFDPSGVSPGMRDGGKGLCGAVSLRATAGTRGDLVMLLTPPPTPHPPFPG